MNDDGTPASYRSVEVDITATAVEADRDISHVLTGGGGTRDSRRHAFQCGQCFIKCCEAKVAWSRWASHLSRNELTCRPISDEGRRGTVLALVGLRSLEFDQHRGARESFVREIVQGAVGLAKGIGTHG